MSPPGMTGSPRIARERRNLASPVRRDSCLADGSCPPCSTVASRRRRVCSHTGAVPPGTLTPGGNLARSTTATASESAVDAPRLTAPHGRGSGRHPKCVLRRKKSAGHRTSVPLARCKFTVSTNCKCSQVSHLHASLFRRQTPCSSDAGLSPPILVGWASFVAR